jgi:hypothetical protein
VSSAIQREIGVIAQHGIRSTDIGLIDRCGLFTRFAPPREGLRDPGKPPAQLKLSGIMPIRRVDNHSG